MFIIKVLDSNLDRFKEYSMLSIRIALGVVFLTHGSQKLFGFFGGGGIAGTIRFMDMMGFGFAAFFGIALSCAEFFGGLLTLLGLFYKVGSTLYCHRNVGCCFHGASKTCFFCIQ